MTTCTNIACPSVDIVIISHNEAKYIGACLGALQQQDYPADKIRVILVDNGSTDDTLAIARTFRPALLENAQGSLSELRNQGVVRGTGQLVGFLDAHCIVEPTWVKHMAAGFTNPTMGGTQGYSDYVCEHPRLQAFQQQTGFLTPESFHRYTLSGEDHAYPWIVTGNALFRREALEAVDLFTADLHRCEDVDLSWKVLLKGYQLSYEPKARLIHYEQRSWQRFIAKHIDYGIGTAQLAARYNLSGLYIEKPRRSLRQPFGLDSFLTRACFQGGYHYGLAALKLSGKRRTAQPDNLQTSPHLRPVFSWAGEQTLAISPEAVFWQKNDTTSVIIHHPSASRYELQGAAHQFWQGLAQQHCRDHIIQSLIQDYTVSQSELAKDLDEFIKDLLVKKVLFTAKNGEPFVPEAIENQAPA